MAWSLNPQDIIDENEFFTASLKDRLLCAKKCEASGYKLAFHFDPVIYFENWQKESVPYLKRESKSSKGGLNLPYCCRKCQSRAKCANAVALDFA